MASDQMRYLSHLIETLSTNNDERDTLRKLRVKELNEGHVLSEIKQFKDEEKIQIFETCLDIIASDRKLDEPELAFINTLRQACNIGFRDYRKKLKKAKKINQAKMPLKRTILSFITAAFVVQ